MKNNIFELSTEELKDIANKFQEKIEEGLKKDNQEIKDIPTHITPKEVIPDGKVLALDWGGTNFRAVIVEFKGGKPAINKAVVTTLQWEGKELSIKETKEKENKPYLEMVTMPLSAKETSGFLQENLYSAIASAISKLEYLDETVTSIGYCFSYPARAEINGDATLLEWTKGIDIKDMQGEYTSPNDPNNIVGDTLVRYLNNHKNIKPTFTNIKVVNDTVACLFGGLSASGFDNYIGLIVGTGTNMASLMRHNQIVKLKSHENWLLPINLESGNFNPPYLTVIDGLVDAMSNNKGKQRFEKAISGNYIGEIFKTVFSHEKIKYNFNGEDLSDILENPDKNPAEKVQVASWIAERSAKLVVASIVGLVQVLVKQNPETKNIALAADGSVFWKTPNYKKIVEQELKNLLPGGVSVTVIPEMEDPNLVGAAIAALS